MSAYSAETTKALQTLKMAIDQQRSVYENEQLLQYYLNQRSAVTPDPRFSVINVDNAVILTIIIPLICSSLGHRGSSWFYSLIALISFTYGLTQVMYCPKNLIKYMKGSVLTNKAEEYLNAHSQQLIRLTEAKKVFDKICDAANIPVAYRSLPALCMFREYIQNGRCCRLEGIDGAYNLYENEKKDEYPD